MVEVLLQGIAAHLEEATVRNWFFEEGDNVQEGDDLVEIATEDGTVMIQVPCTGVLTEVYYDEGEVVAKDEVLCSIDDSEAGLEDMNPEDE